MILLKYTFNIQWKRKHLSNYKVHKEFNSDFTLHPFTAMEHFDVKTPKYNVTSHYF